MSRLTLVCVAAAAGLLWGCSSSEATIVVERLPDIQASLPEVPTLPPAPYPVQYPDGTYSVYGLRHRIRNTIDSDVGVTAYIVEIYKSPECPEGRTCPPASAPHIWVADTPSEADEGKSLMVAGYAENQIQIDEAIEDARRGRREVPPPESGIIPIPVDFAAGAKVKVTGRFARVSGAGFNVSDGMIDYRSHAILQAAPGAAALR